MKTSRGEGAGGAAALMVFCIFAMLAFSVLMLGAGAHKSIAAISREGAIEQICLSYIWTRVKSNDDVGMVRVRDFDGTPALYLEEKYGDTAYNTIIYHHDGWVYELVAESGFDFIRGDGLRVVQADAVSFEQLDNEHILVSSGIDTAFLSLRGERGIAHNGGER